MREDNQRNILIGIAVIIIIILLVIFLVRRRQQSPLITVNSPLPTPTTSFEDNLQNNFGITVPTNATRADLKDVTGKNQMGLLTIDKENGQSKYTVIANLEEPAGGSFYQAWLVNGTNRISLGKLSVAKAGWMVNYDTATDLSSYKTIWITLEKVNDANPETHILEGMLQ